MPRQSATSASTEVSVDGKARPASGKLDSDAAPVIRLRPNPKLVDGLRARSANAAVRIVAFKLTHGGDRDEAGRAVAALFGALRRRPRRPERPRRAGRARKTSPPTIHFSDGRPPERCATRGALAAALERILAGLPATAAALA